MDARRTGTITAGVLILGLLAWWLASDDADRAPEAPATDETPAASPPGPALTADGEQQPNGDAAPETTEPPAPPAVDAPPTVRLEGRVQVRGRSTPPLVDVALLRKGVEPKARGEAGNRYELDAHDPGRFAGEVAGVDLSKFWLCVKTRGVGDALPAFRDGASLLPGELIEIELAPARKLEVEVLDDDGRPVERAQIGMAPLQTESIHTHAYPGDATMGGWSLPIPEGEHRHTFHLPYAGALRVSARKRGYARAHAIVEEGETAVVLRLSQSPNVIRVRLENADAWPNATAYLEVDGDRYGRWPPRNGQRNFRDGVAQFENQVGPGRYRIKVTSWDAQAVYTEPFAITSETREVTRSVRLERRAGFGRLILVFDLEALGMPKMWWQHPEFGWQQWMLHFAHAEGRELRSLQARPTNVVLFTPDGKLQARLTDVEVPDRADLRVTPDWVPVRRFLVASVPPAAAKLDLHASWIETDTRKREPVFGLRADVSGHAPNHIALVKHFEHLHLLVPANAATLVQEGKDGTLVRIPLRLVAD